MIKSLLDTDLYKLLMMQAVFHQYPDYKVEYEFISRGKESLGFLATQVKKEVEKISKLKFSEEEVEYLRGLNNEEKIFKDDFLNYLKDFYLKEEDVEVSVNDNLKINIKGLWLETILWEIYLLSTVNEAYFKRYDSSERIEEGKKSLEEKIKKIKNEPNLNITEFGTRRRFSREWQEYVVKRLSSLKNNYIGTSNVYLSKKMMTFPVGTHAHEWFQAHQAMDYFNSQELALEAWKKEYMTLRIALSDIYGTDAFLKTFSRKLTMAYDGLRHDSGNPIEWTDKVLNHYKAMQISTKNKKLIFSDGLDVDKAIAINNYCYGKIKTLFGIGTNLTNDLGVKPLSIVIKMVKCNGKDVIKISDEPAKALGPKYLIERIQKYFGGGK